MVSRALKEAGFLARLARTLGSEARQAGDFACMRELDAGALGLRMPAGLALTWLGTAGFALAYQGHTLLIDPYISRASLRDVLLARTLSRDTALLDRLVPQASAVLVGHTHFDHALDVPEIARRRDCKAYGSSSFAHLMRLHGLADRAVQVEHGRVYAIGPFEVTFIESLHAKLVLGWSVPNDGEITCEHLDAMGSGQYRCGAVYGIHVRVAGVTFYHQGSANLIEDRIPYRSVDYLLMGIAGRRFTRDCTARTLRTLAPAVVVPTHYDDFFRPLTGKMGFSFNVRFDRFVDEAAQVSRDFSLRTLEPLKPLQG